jgi:hypothetical protein
MEGLDIKEGRWCCNAESAIKGGKGGDEKIEKHEWI